ncbi:MAG: CRISPR-associated endonuclease Cas3'' [Thermoprotei archaeon]|nr:MAG: CRISPR-associated endonuclease Cas3'' [Thermoprotei archaeon]
MVMMRNTALTLKADSEGKELLIDHLVMVGRCCYCLAHHLKLSEPTAMFAGALHDLGKALSYYQNIGSFAGHEVISAYITHALISDRVIKLRNGDPLHIIYPILFHHQAHRELPRAVNRLINVRNRLNLNRDANTLVKLLTELSIELRGYNLYIDVSKAQAAINKALKDIAEEDAKYLTSVLYANYLRDIDVEKLIKSRIYCGVLMMCDKYISVINRGGAKSSLYFKSVNSFIKYHKII